MSDGIPFFLTKGNYQLYSLEKEVTENLPIERFLFYDNRGCYLFLLFSFESNLKNSM
jgi:hypothetical protein